MINDDHVNNLRSEASRLGYYNLPIDTFLSQVCSSFKSIFGKKKNELEQKRSAIDNEIIALNRRLNEKQQKMSKSKVEWYHVFSFGALVTVLIGVVSLWQNLVWGNMLNQQWIAYGTITACCLFGSMINKYCVKMEKGKKKSMLFVIGATAILFTFVFSLESLEPIYVVRSALYSTLIGIIIYTINYIFFPIVDGFIGVLHSLIDMAKIIFYRFTKYRKENVLEKIKTELHHTAEQQSTITNTTLEQLGVDYLLGQRASAKEDIEDTMNNIDYPSTIEEMAHA